MNSISSLSPFLWGPEVRQKGLAFLVTAPIWSHLEASRASHLHINDTITPEISRVLRAVCKEMPKTKTEYLLVLPHYPLKKLLPHDYFFTFYCMPCVVRTSLNSATLLGPLSECSTSALHSSCPLCLWAGGQWLHAMTHSAVLQKSPRLAFRGLVHHSRRWEREQWTEGSLLFCHYQRHHQSQTIEKGVTLSLALLKKFLKSLASALWGHRQQVIAQVTQIGNIHTVNSSCISIK